MTARMLWNQFLNDCNHAWDTWRSFCLASRTLKFGIFFRSENESQCYVDPHIQKSNSSHQCNRFAVYLTHMTHTRQTLEHLKVFHFWRAENSGKSTAVPYGSVDAHQIDPKNCKHVALHVEVQENHAYIQHTGSFNELLEFKDWCVFIFLKSRSDVFVYSVLSIYALNCTIFPGTRLRQNMSYVSQCFWQGFSFLNWHLIRNAFRVFGHLMRKNFHVREAFFWFPSTQGRRNGRAGALPPKK